MSARKKAAKKPARTIDQIRAAARAIVANAQGVGGTPMVGESFDSIMARRVAVLEGIILALRTQIEKSGQPLGGADAIWYGPHSCQYCGEMIVKRDVHQGPELSLDALLQPAYPNALWLIHICRRSGPLE